MTADFLNNFAGDNVRRLAKSFGVPGKSVSISPQVHLHGRNLICVCYRGSLWTV